MLNEEEVDLRQYVDIIRRRLWLIVLSTVLSAIAAFVVSLNMTPIYQASTMLRVSSPPNPRGITDIGALQTGQRLAETYAQLLSKDPVLDGVINNLGLDMTAKELQGAVKVRAVRSTDLIEITVENADPVKAQRIANEIPKIFSQQDQLLRSSQYSQIKANLTEEMNQLEEKIRNLQKTIAEKKTSETADKDTALIILESELEQARSDYSTLLQTYGNIQLAEVQSSGSVITVVPAKVPDKPVRPRPKLNTLLAAVVGAMLAVGMAFLVEYLDDTLKTPDDVQASLGVATLTLVPERPKGRSAREDHLTVAPDSRSPFSEAYRVLRANIRFISVDEPVRSLVVTSASPNEGKSTVVANLGIVMAQAGQRVIILEGDLRRPALHKVFRLAGQRGLTNALVDRSTSLGDLLQETGIDNLRVLAGGPLPPNPSELLESQRMARLVNQLKDEADVLLLDSPPVMVSADASILADMADGTLLVVDSKSTRREVAEQAILALNRGRVRVLGVVLNNVALTRRSYYYSYYYSDDGVDDSQQHRHGGSQGVRDMWHRLRSTRKPDGQVRSN